MMAGAAAAGGALLVSRLGRSRRRGGWTIMLRCAGPFFTGTCGDLDGPHWPRHMRDRAKRPPRQRDFFERFLPAADGGRRRGAPLHRLFRAGTCRLSGAHPDLSLPGVPPPAGTPQAERWLTRGEIETSGAPRRTRPRDRLARRPRGQSSSCRSRGSGRIRLPDGGPGLRVGFGGKNGHPLPVGGQRDGAPWGSWRRTRSRRR